VSDVAANPEPRRPAYVLRLYVSGATPTSTRALANILRICEEHLAGQYELDVIDAYQQPQDLAEAEIVGLPTLVRSLPEPVRRLVGDMSDEERVLIGLDLKIRPSHPVAG
jgi:circadian clock protein KaiB